MPVTSKEVLMVRAGLSGAVAALELSHADIKVTFLEQGK
jgi:monoamine oxidase